MQIGSSETRIGWKSGKPLMYLYGTEYRERGYGLSWQGMKARIRGFHYVQFCQTN
jgi:hypothetical protein